MDFEAISNVAFRMKILEFDIFVNVSFWATARLVNFSPMFFEFVRAVFAPSEIDLSTFVVFVGQKFWHPWLARPSILVTRN